MRPDVGGRRKARGRRLFEGRRVAGVTSVIAPLAVGVVLAFAWNTAGSYKPGSPTPNPGFSPEVEVAAEQAAAQTWARMTPEAHMSPEAHMTPAEMTGNSPGSADRDTSLPAGPTGPRGSACRRPGSASSTAAALEGLLTPQPGRRVLSVTASTAGCAAPRKPRRAGEGESPVSARPARPASGGAAQQLRDLRAQAQLSRA
jgi:hypothetical protein